MICVDYIKKTKKWKKYIYVIHEYSECNNEYEVHRSWGSFPSIVNTLCSFLTLSHTTGCLTIIYNPTIWTVLKSIIAHQICNLKEYPCTATLKYFQNLLRNNANKNFEWPASSYGNASWHHTRDLGLKPAITQDGFMVRRGTLAV